MKYLIANWKSHKTLSEVKTWMNVFLSYYHEDKNIQQSLIQQNISIILCPPYPFITTVLELTKNIQGVSLGSQDISAFPPGKYTGEVSARSLSGLTRYAIVGHHERKKYFHETHALIERKIANAIENSIIPIVCVDSTVLHFTELPRFIAYEPAESIGTGFTMPLEEIIKVKKQMRLSKSQIFIYGGSIKPENVKKYLESDEINGLLIGSTSLHIQDFISLMQNLTSK